jgi:hypothetical protein
MAATIASIRSELGIVESRGAKFAFVGAHADAHKAIATITATRRHAPAHSDHGLVAGAGFDMQVLQLVLEACHLVGF